MLLITLLIGWIVLGIEMDIFIPSFPEIQNVFSITPFMVELTLATNFIAHCFTCIITGTLGDRFGYRPIILLGALIFVIGSILCATATIYNILLLGRILQGAGVAGTSTLSYLILTNIYSTEKQHEILGWLNGVITLAMAIAPIIGSYIALLFHWRGNFIALLIIGSINLIFSYIFIPSSKANKSASFSWKEYKIIFHSKKTLYYILSICFCVTPYWIFAGIAPILYMQGFGVSLKEFGFYQGSLALVFAICSFGSGAFIKKFGRRKSIYLGVLLSILFLFLCVIILLLKINDPLIITLALTILCISETVPSNIIYPMMFEILPEAKAKTSAVLTAIRMIVISLGLQLVSYFYDGTFMLLGIVISICSSIMLWFTYMLFIRENELARL